MVVQIIIKILGVYVSRGLVRLCLRLRYHRLRCVSMHGKLVLYLLVSRLAKGRAKMCLSADMSILRAELIMDFTLHMMLDMWSTILFYSFFYSTYCDGIILYI